MNINERIKFLRKEILDLTQEDFSKKINISRSNLGSIEINRINVTDRVISDICHEFHINENWLRTGDGDIHISQNAEYAEICANIALEKDEYKKMVYSKLSKLDDASWELLRYIFSDTEKQIFK